MEKGGHPFHSKTLICLAKSYTFKEDSTICVDKEINARVQMNISVNAMIANGRKVIEITQL
jgi:hypothetical protein